MNALETLIADRTHSVAAADRYDETSWRVDNIPGWGTQWLPEVPFAQISKQDFFRNYADQWKPLIVRNACRHWNAFGKWADDAYFLERWGSAKVNLFVAPNPQGEHPDTLDTQRKAQVPGTFADLIRSQGKNVSIRAHTLGSGSPLDDMIEDIDDHWLHEFTRPSLSYPRRRVFIYRGGASLWHQHPLDDHLTFQVHGAKDFAFLPPDQSRCIAEINTHELYSFKVDTTRYPGWKTIRPWSARLQAGDAIYIPPGWWHTVVPLDQELGITLASVWGSSRRAILTHGLRDMFYAGNRKYLRYFPLVLLYAITGWRKVLSRAHA